jgi:thiol-disulfide isomerase/thioredoxin
VADVGPDHLQVVDLEGIKKIIAESDAADQVLVIDFWATWCVPCIEMLPGIHEGLVDRGATGMAGAAVRAVTVTMDDPSREAAAMDFLREHDALHDAYIFVNDSAAQQALADGLGDKWNSLAIPAILVYDSEGNLAGEFLEGGLTQAILDRVDRLLASGQENQP